MKIFIIHGWTYSLDKWNEVCAILLTRGIEPVLLKVPGLTEPSDKVWDINNYIEWLDNQLKGHDHPVVIGHSNGGRIALAYIQRHPNRLQRLILIDSAGIAHDDFKTNTKLWVLRVLAKLGKPLEAIPLLKKVFYKIIGGKDYFNAPPNMKLTMQNMLEANRTIGLSAITLPVTIIWGRNDTITPLSDGLQFKEGIKGSTLHIVDEAGHSPYANNPGAVADIIVDALKVKT